MCSQMPVFTIHSKTTCMDNELYNDEFLVRYLDGELNDAERIDLENQITKDPLLKERVNNIQLAIEGIRQAAVAEKVRGLHKTIMTELAADEEKSDRPVPRIFRYAIGIAASIILIVSILGIYTYQLSSEEVYEDHFLNYTTTVSRGSLEYPSKTPELFSQGRYNEIVELNKNHQPIPADLLLIAISYLHLNQPASAIPILKDLRKNQQLKEDADYYLGMAYLKNKDLDAAFKELKNIHENEKHAYHQQVSPGLIRELRLLKWKE